MIEGEIYWGIRDYIVNPSDWRLVRLDVSNMTIMISYSRRVHNIERGVDYLSPKFVFGRLEPRKNPPLLRVLRVEFLFKLT